MLRQCNLPLTLLKITDLIFFKAAILTYTNWEKRNRITIESLTLNPATSDDSCCDITVK